MEESYVSFEIAKLLKEKGFNEPCRYNYWNSDNMLVSESGLPTCNEIYIGDRCSAPTQALVMKWLREVHNFVICAEIGNENDKDNIDYYNPDRWYWFFDITNEKGVVIDIESDFI